MKCYVDLSCHVVMQVTLMWHVVVMQVTLMWHVVVMQVTLMWHVVVMQVTLMWHVVVIVCVFKFKNIDNNILLYSMLQRSCAQERESTCTASCYHSPYPIQYRLGILYILTGGDVIETSCIWNFINVLCLDTSETFCFGTEIFFLSFLSLLLTLTMELSERLIQVKSTAKHEKDFPSYTQDDVVFLFGDVIKPVGLVLNHKNPLECYVLFPPAAPMQDIASLVEIPHGWGSLCNWAYTSHHLACLQ